MKRIKVYIEKPTLRQRIVMLKCNFLLWLASLIFEGDELKREQIDLIKQFRSEL